MKSTRLAEKIQAQLINSLPVVNRGVTDYLCGQDSVDPRLIELLEQLRTKAGKSIHINCGYRCPKHNAEVGGVSNSQHVLGTAADITIPEIGSHVEW